MRIFKNKEFNKWAAKEGLSDHLLLLAVAEIGTGLVDADLGGGLFKKRVALGGRGKRGGARTIVAFRAKSRAFFVYAFAKNVRANIMVKERQALKLYAEMLMSYSDQELQKALDAGALIEVKNNG